MLKLRLQEGSSGIMLRIAPTALTAGCLTALLFFGACGGDGTSDLFGPGSKAGSGGLASSGTSNGGSSNTGGRTTGGNAGGGRAASGGSDAGGSDVGGSDVGGSDDGGSASGGADTGGRSSGGRAATGGKASGGAPNGGKASGGAPNGGSATGGVTTGSGGATGGKSAGGATACSETDGSNVQVQGTSKGLNGSFTDECKNGALIEYYCETVPVVDPSCLLASSPNGGSTDIAAPRPIPTCEIYTGQVVSHQVDCDGMCKDGTCMYWCPTVEHEVEYHETGSGTAVLHNNDLDFVYDCQVTWERDDYDCSDPDLVGSYVGVYSLGACTLDNIVFGTDTPEEPGIQTCTFDCTLID
jgi:hypothetical protein